jgi:hypothetical protein
VSVLGQLVKEMRLAAALSQRDLATRAGTSQPAIARYEKGVATPAWDTLQRLAFATGHALKVSAVPLPKAGTPELAELMLEWSPLERLWALKHYARTELQTR